MPERIRVTSEACCFSQLNLRRLHLYLWDSTPGGTKLNLDYTAMLAVALSEARKGLAEGGIPIGAAIFDAQGKLLGAGSQSPRAAGRSFDAR